MNSKEKDEMQMMRMEEIRKSLKENPTIIAMQLREPWYDRYDDIDLEKGARVWYWCAEYVLNHLFAGDGGYGSGFASKDMLKERMELAVKSIAEELGLGLDEVEGYLNDRIYEYANADADIKECFEAARIRWTIRESKQWWKEMRKELECVIPRMADDGVGRTNSWKKEDLDE